METAPFDSRIITEKTSRKEKNFRYQSGNSFADFTSYMLSDNCILNKGEGQSDQDNLITEQQDNAYFVLFFQMGGQSENLSFEKPHLQVPGSVSFYYFHQEGAVNFLKGEKSDFITLMALPGYVTDKVLSSGNTSPALRTSIDSLTSHTMLLNSSFYNPATAMVLEQIKNCPYTGKIKEVYLEGKYLELLALYFESISFGQGAAGAQGITPGDIKKIKDVKEYLKTVFETPPTLARISRVMGLNEFKLKRGFKEVFGMTVFDYIRHLRMEKGRKLLLDGGKNVTEVSYLVGYSNPSNFTRNFKKQFGINPKKISS